MSGCLAESSLPSTSLSNLSLLISLLEEAYQRVAASEATGTRQSYGQLNRTEWDETLTDSGASNMFMFYYTLPWFKTDTSSSHCSSEMFCWGRHCTVYICVSVCRTTGKIHNYFTIHPFSWPASCLNGVVRVCRSAHGVMGANTSWTGH